MLSDFGFTQEGHRGRINSAKHRIELSSADEKPIHSAPYQAGPKVRDFEKNEFDKMLSDAVIEPAQRERAEPIVLAQM